MQNLDMLATMFDFITSLGIHFSPPFAGHSTATGGQEKYRPSFLDHFEKKEQENQGQQRAQPATVAAPQPAQQKQVTPPHHFNRSLIDGDFEFVSNCTTIFPVIISLSSKLFLITMHVTCFK